jgi:hypothetical protein
MKYILTISLIVLISSCTPKKTIYSGEYTTVQLRSMWATCASLITQSQPNTPPFFLYPKCDCVIDKIRENLSPDQLDIAEKNNSVIDTNYFVECSN